MFQVSIYDKIIEVDKVAKEIFKDVLEEKQGLTAKGGKIEAYQFDQDLTISNTMIGDQAVDAAQQRARFSHTMTSMGALEAGGHKGERANAGDLLGSENAKNEKQPAATSTGDRQSAADPPSATGLKKRGDL